MSWLKRTNQPSWYNEDLEELSDDSIEDEDLDPLAEELPDEVEVEAEKSNVEEVYLDQAADVFVEEVTVESSASPLAHCPRLQSPEQAPVDDDVASDRSRSPHAWSPLAFYPTSPVAPAFRPYHCMEKSDTTSKTPPSRGRHQLRDISPKTMKTKQAPRKLLAVTTKRLRKGEDVIQVALTDTDIPTPRKELSAATNAKTLKVTKNTNINALESDTEIADYLFGGDISALNFQWSPMDSFVPQPEKFLPKNLGPTFKPATPYEAFRFFNRYAEGINGDSFKRLWYDTNKDEIFMLFAFWMMLGVVRMPSIRSCYSKHSMLDIGSFRKIMGVTRFWNLNRALYFNDLNKKTARSSKTYLIEPVVKHLNKKFKEAYVPGQNIAIDESVTHWKGHKGGGNKPLCKTAGEKGIKTLELCESGTGYLCSFILYEGKEKTGRQNKSTQIVLSLIKPFLNKGYRVFTNYWFNSPILARFLKRNRTDCVGTVKQKCKNVPDIVQLGEIPKGQFIARHAGDVMVMGYQDKKYITMISTCHGVETEPVKTNYFRPSVMKEYNKNMGGVDLKDHLLEPYLIERKRCLKWYKKLFKRLLNVSINNSSIIFSATTGCKVNQMQFRLGLVSEIVERHSLLVPRIPKPQPPKVKTPIPFEKRYAPANNHYVVKAEARRMCQWCSAQGYRTRVTWKCEQCDVWLCIVECFKNYHTLPLV